ncbi:MAG: hypothetical protein ACHQZR_08335, partial [Candidatus Limnocylindrales bacterium]
MPRATWLALGGLSVALAADVGLFPAPGGGALLLCAVVGLGISGALRRYRPARAAPAWVAVGAASVLVR